MIPTVHLGLDAEQLAEVDRVSGGWCYRPTMSYGDYRSYTFLLAGLFGIGAALLYPDEYHGWELWSGIFLCLAIGLVVLLITSWSRRSKFRQQLAMLRQQSGMATFTAAGVEFNQLSGRPTVWAWSTFRRALVGEQTLLLFRASRAPRLAIIPISTLAPAERAELLTLLCEKVSPGQTKEAPINRLRPRPTVSRQP